MQTQPGVFITNVNASVEDLSEPGSNARYVNNIGGRLQHACMYGTIVYGAHKRKHYKIKKQLTA